MTLTVDTAALPQTAVEIGLAMLDRNIRQRHNACDGNTRVTAVVTGRQGNASIPADQIARLTGTINHEVASSLTRRMPLQYIHTKD